MKISVITVTNGRRPRELRRAIHSVLRQQVPATEHLIVGNNCSWLGQESWWRTLPRSVKFIDVAGPEARYLPEHLGKLRNFGVSRARGDAVAFLDDDNYFDRGHLGTLLPLISEGGTGAHSWRRLYRLPGEPITIVDHSPWVHPQIRDDVMFQSLCKIGVLRPGSSIVRDVAILEGGYPLGHVDTNEWLLPSAVARSVPFRQSYTPEEQARGLNEDRALCLDLIADGTAISCSRKATVWYRLDGVSNHAHEHEVRVP